MQFVSSSTPVEPRFDKISVSLVNPVMSATIRAPWNVDRDGSSCLRAV